MATSVCQGLQTQFNPWLIEPRGIGFDFALSSRCSLRPPMLIEQDTVATTANAKSYAHETILDQKVRETDSSDKISVKKPSKTEGLGGWSFLQALSNATKSAPHENEKVYVHPLAKRSASKLSEKSLEMCTESLGSETGSDMSEIGDELITSLSSESPQKLPRIHHFGERKRSNVVSNFPPPLTTIRDGVNGGGVRVKSQREDGRLVIKAVSVEAQQSLFKAERKDGRLRLHFLSSPSCSQQTTRDNEELLDQDNESDEDDDYSDDNDNLDDLDYDEGDDDEYDDNDYNDDDNNSVGEVPREWMEGDGEDVEGKVEVERFGGTRSCRERLNWEQYN